MFERMKNIFLSFVFPASLLFLTFCSKKEQNLPYEQMPTVANDQAQNPDKKWIADFKKHYTQQHLQTVVGAILDKRLSTLPNTANLESKQQIVDKKGDLSIFSANFIKSIDKTNLFAIKDSLENYIASSVTPQNTPLKYSKADSNGLSPIFSKTGNSAAYTELYELLLASIYPQKDLRKQHFFIIYTPQHQSLGYAIKDGKKDWFIFGLTSTELGAKAITFYGPASQLSPSVVLIDLEFDILLKYMGDSLSNLDQAKSFAIEMTARKYNVNRKKYWNEKKKIFTEIGLPNSDTRTPIIGNYSSVFHVDGKMKDPVPANDGIALENGSFTYADSFSTLQHNGLVAAYKRLSDRLETDAESAKLNLDRSRLKGIDLDSDKWPDTLGDWNGINTFAQNFFKGKAGSGADSDISVQKLTRDRDCVVEDERSIKTGLKFLTKWGLLGSNSAWEIQKLKASGLGICRTTKTRGEFLKGSRILQPVYLTLSKNAPNGGALNLAAQTTLAKSFASAFCSKMVMHDPDSYPSLKDNSDTDVSRLIQELFYNEPTNLVTEFPALSNTRNIFEIRCAFIPNQTILNEIQNQKDAALKEKNKAAPNNNTPTNGNAPLTPVINNPLIKNNAPKVH